MPWRRTTIGLVAALLAVNLALLAQSDIGFAVSLALIVPAVFMLHIVAHEMGHALAGAVLGFRVEEIVSGTGPRLFRFEPGGTGIELRLMPFGGVTHLGVHDPADPGSHLSLRFLLTVAAGPAATALLALVFAEPLLSSWTDTMTMPNGSTRTYDAADIARTYGVWMVLLNLLPIGARDGAQILSVMRAGDSGRKVIDQRIAGALFAFQVERYRTEAVRRACVEEPELLDNPYIRHTHAVALLFEQRPDEARRSLEHLDVDELPDQLRKLVPYTVAVACLEVDPERSREETDQWIERTIWARGAQDPLSVVVDALRATRRGEHHEALRLVESGLGRRPPAGFNPNDIAFLHHAAAEAHRRNGDLESASTSIRNATRLRPGHPMIEREADRIHQAAEAGNGTTVVIADSM